jgi:hypothetical protein
MNFSLALFKEFIGLPNNRFLLLWWQSLNLMTMIIKGVEILLGVGLRRLPIAGIPRSIISRVTIAIGGIAVTIARVSIRRVTAIAWIPPESPFISAILTPSGTTGQRK